MTSNEIRQKYLDYFKSKGHAVLPSASLMPENDPSTLFTGSGMQPMVPFLLGQPHPEGKRLVDSQKCFRSQDIEEVGDNRHTTFFEMLGNWSLGDYFKEEQISWMFDFLTKEISLDPSRLYITVFRGNEEIGIPRDAKAVELWKAKFAEAGIDAKDIDFSERDGMQDGRIFYYDEKKNWWSRVGVPGKMPVGEPGGPDTEMFWDFGAELGLHETSSFKDEPCHINCDCGRFMEIGNNVFMEYVRTKEGFELLPQKNVDFGGGLERIVAAKHNNPDVFHGDLFDRMRQLIESLSGKTYAKNPQETKAFRVVMDHLRAATFLIADGAFPSNKDQGYFTRRLIRRAVRFASQLGIEEMVCVRLAEAVLQSYQDAYPALTKQKSVIMEELQKEEDKFRKTLQTGLKEFEKLKGQAAITGEQAFLLFSTYGFPLEMTQELAAEAGLQVDTIEFAKEMDKHKDQSRLGAQQKFSGGLADHSQESTRLHTATHLLHTALRKVLGDHVYQKGSNITPERLRFDFSHPDKMTKEQIAQVEQLVNDAIKADLPVSFVEMDIEEARKTGAIGVFEERYGNKVKVYKMGDYSMEICGGPHVNHTGELGGFKILKEEASSGGVRRIKAVVLAK
jgi:alanyl-tRNA synthetase